MKYMLCSIAVASLAFASCRSSEDRVNPSGSYPDFKTGNVSKGELIVENVTPTLLPRKGEPATLYIVYDEQGKQVAEATTASTSLAAGRYMIRPAQADPDVKTFWVTVEAGKTTRVDVSKSPATVD